ncbi:hypothetical protein COU96_01590 [Candidatus Shapirobacteria bacterium CG10_big_fil_rev_8_21_14_0_10_38_14]|uniref:Uncharacterized protein n=1 Tax=Candidatus Shapirobacteria bacterium CG10_big_fil_rev_8_21_14_0_10_38_14 TaxID=1974483 RepID=A0A2M8L5N0_9BACT|nr:MAG: hypothetical protein COU96_01590 [Candidatus Shapirobacteria bacterium CG10_big_fil_rev_8_21_14_0_10_38_14]
MPIGERIRKEREQRAIVAAQETLATQRLVVSMAEKLNRRVIEEAKPFLDVLEKAGIYEMFCDIRSELKLVWKQTDMRGFVDSILRDTLGDWGLYTGKRKMPALLETLIGIRMRAGSRKIVIDEEQNIVEGFGVRTEDSRSHQSLSLSEHKKILERILVAGPSVENCSLVLKWDYDEYWQDLVGTSCSWKELLAEVIRDSKSGALFLKICSNKEYGESVVMTPNEYRDRTKVEDAVVKVWQGTFS